MGKIFEFTSVSAGYDDEIVLKDVNFTVGDNDFVGVIGPNGGGKTTLLKLILGEIKPKRGTIEYFKREPNEVLFGYLPQVIGIDKKFPISVMEVVLSGLLGRKGIMGRYTGHDKRMSLNLLQRMEIQHLKDKAIGELSGGQMQRVFLCRALISHPRLLILDEPNTFVDNKFEKELYELLQEQQRWPLSWFPRSGHHHYACQNHCLRKQATPLPPFEPDYNRPGLLPTIVRFRLCPWPMPHTVLHKH